MSENGIERLCKTYIGALGLARIFIVERDNGKCRFARGEPGDGSVAFEAFLDPAAADFVLMAARDRARSASDATHMERALYFVAEELGAEIKTAEELQQSARAAVERVSSVFDKMRAGGELRDINSRYREYRLGRTSAGKNAQKYSAWIWGEKLAAVKRTAALVAKSRVMSAKLRAAIESASATA